MKYLYSILIVVLFAVGFAASEESEHDKAMREIKIKSITGTYMFSDEEGVNYTLNLNSDYTMTAEANGKCYYGTWDDLEEYIKFEFSGSTNEYPRIRFKADKKYELSSWIDNDYTISNDGFLYGCSQNKATKHDPDYRLKIKKKDK